MGHRNSNREGVEDVVSHEFTPSYSSGRSKSAPSKKELRQLCIARDRSKKAEVFPEPELEQHPSAMLR